MICYRDRSWCNPSTCQGKCGDRKFTEEDRERAIQWWGGEDFPLCVGNYCGDINDEQTETTK